MTQIRDVASDFQLKRYRIKSLKLTSEEINKGSKGTIEYNLDYEKDRLDSENDWKGKITLYLNAHAKAEDDKKMFDIDTILEGVFHAPKGNISEDLFDKHLDVNGLTILTQIMRSFLISVTSQWGVGPSVILPMINIHRLIEKKSKEVECSKQSISNIDKPEE